MTDRVGLGSRTPERLGFVHRAMSDERDELRDLVERLGVEWLAADRESDREFAPSDAREHYWAQLRSASRRIQGEGAALMQLLPALSLPARRALLECSSVPREIVVASLDDAEESVREQAAAAIRSHVDEDVRLVLERRLGDPSSSWNMRLAAFTALLALDPRRAVDLVASHRSFDHLRDWHQRLAASRSGWTLDQRRFAIGDESRVGALGPDALVAMLAPLLDDPDRDARARAIAKLEANASPAAVRLLEGHLERALGMTRTTGATSTPGADAIELCSDLVRVAEALFKVGAPGAVVTTMRQRLRTVDGSIPGELVHTLLSLSSASGVADVARDLLAIAEKLSMGELRLLHEAMQRAPWSSLPTQLRRELQMKLVLLADLPTALAVLGEHGVDERAVRTVVARFSRIEFTGALEERLIDLLVAARAMSRGPLRSAPATDISARLHCAAALIEVGEQGDHEFVLESLRPLLVSSDRKVRRVATTLVGKLGELAREALLGSIAGEDDVVLFELKTNTLRAIDPARAVLVLVEALGRDDEAVQHKAAATLAGMETVDDADALMGQLAAMFQTASLASRVCILRACCAPAFLSHSATVERLVVSSLEGRPVDQAVLDVVISLVNRHGWQSASASLFAALSAMRSREKFDERRIEEALIRIGSSSAEQALDMLEQPSISARSSAIRILGGICETRATPHLVRILDHETSPALRGEALYALGRIADPSTIDRVGRCLVTTQDSDERDSAIAALALFRNEAALPYFEEFIAADRAAGWLDRFETVIDAVEAVGSTAAKELLWRLANMTEDANSQEYAMHALMQLGDPKATAWWNEHGSPLFSMAWWRD
jgi:HEAT repeat protein